MLLRNATFPDGHARDLRIEGDRIGDVDDELTAEPREGTIDAGGLRVLPGAIDVHVHFREPGAAHKETWASGTRSAAAGGVTTVVDQPNTDPPSVTGAAFDEKAELAGDALVDYGLNGGVTPDWEPETLLARPLFALGEIFLADSTGEMGIDPPLFADAVSRAAEVGVPVTVHAEDAAEFDDEIRDRTDPAAWSDYRPPAAEVAAIERVVSTATDRDVPVHIAHASTPEGIDTAAEAGLTTEVTPHHLFLSTADLPELGTYGRMNPPLRDEPCRADVWSRLVDGTIDMVASDHAPHTAAEKDADIWSAPSGVPGVETLLPLLLAAAERGEISYERVAEVTARRPAAVFDIEGKGGLEPGTHADLVLVDPAERRPIETESLHSACEWTPFDRMEGLFPLLTMVRGRVVFEDGRFGDPAGRNVRGNPS